MTPIFIFLPEKNSKMDRKGIAQKLSKSVAFRGVGTDDLNELLGKIRYGIKSYEKGETIVMRDESCAELRIVLKGSVRGEMLDFSGKIVKIEDIEAPRPLAIAFLFGKNATYPVDIIANVKTEILSIPKKDVVQLMGMNQLFLTNFLNNVSNRAQFLSRKLFFLSFKTLREKVANYLKEQYKDQGENITLNVTQENLANLFGVTRPSLARIMGELDKEGIIKVDRKQIEILDKKRLFS